MSTGGRADKGTVRGHRVPKKRIFNKKKDCEGDVECMIWAKRGKATLVESLFLSFCVLQQSNFTGNEQRVKTSVSTILGNELNCC